MNKISATRLFLLVAMGLNQAAFAKNSENSSKLSSNQKPAQAEHDVSQTLVLGKVISASQFRKITQYTNSKAIRNPIDFCVGIIDDEEQAMQLEGLSDRQYHNQYAIEHIIFAAKTENFKVAYASTILNKNSTANQITGLKAEVIKSTAKGIWVDGFRQQKYPYTSSYQIRKLDQDDLIYAYFDGQKLIGLQYVVQC